MISIIAAMDQRRVIGIRDGEMPWGRSLKDDLQRFNRLTEGHTVIMGRKTFTDDIKRPLPRRRNIVITGNQSFQVEGVVVCHSIEEAVGKVNNDENGYIIGGGQIYRQGITFALEMHLTCIEHVFGGDVLFPEFDRGEWDMLTSTLFPRDERNAYPVNLQHWIRS